MANLVDIRKVDVVVSGTFGTLNFRNWGESGVSISVSSIDPELYKEKLGANGDMLFSKSYKPNNKLVTMQVLPKSADYLSLQAIVANEEAGGQEVFVCTVKDNLTGEQFTSSSCVLKVSPTVDFGDDIGGDVEYQILMASTVHIV